MKPSPPKAVSNNRYPKYKTHFTFGYRYRQRVQYPFFVFFNNKTQKRIISANMSPEERILRFRLYLS